MNEGIHESNLFSPRISKYSSMPINVLAFAGSPRWDGDSETLLDWVLVSMGEEPPGRK